MRSTGIFFLSHRTSRGFSSVMGTLIFVGILFSTVVPMFLVMKQADTLFEQEKHELGRFDEERKNEDLYVYVYPVGVLSTNLKISVQNKGATSVKITRLWINDDLTDVDFNVEPMSGTQLLGTYLLTPEEGSEYIITVTTDRGRNVAFDTQLTWQDEYAGWTTGDTFSVNVLISSLPGHEFKIQIHQGESLFAEGHTEKFDPKFFIVPSAGLYTVKIFRGSNLLYMKEVTISWPDGSPVEWVFA